MKLSNNEYNVLQKISAKTKADCWFSIEEKPSGDDYILDLEEEKEYSLTDGISMLLEAVDCRENYSNCNLSKQEEITLRHLLKRLNLKQFNF